MPVATIDHAQAATPVPLVTELWAPRLVLVGVVLLAAAAGAWLSADTASVRAAEAAGPELTRLLEAMAVLKAVMAAAAVWLVDWRLRYAARPVLAGGYVMAAALMAAAPGVMWHLAHVMAGGALFHTGLVILIVLGFTDRQTAREMLTGMIRRRRAQAGGRS